MRSRCEEAQTCQGACVPRKQRWTDIDPETGAASVNEFHGTEASWDYEGRDEQKG